MSLSTGHSSPQEWLMLIKAAKEKGVHRIYVQRLRQFGFTQAEIDAMTKIDPARFLGLEKW